MSVVTLVERTRHVGVSSGVVQGQRRARDTRGKRKRERERERDGELPRSRKGEKNVRGGINGASREAGGGGTWMEKRENGLYLHGVLWCGPRVPRPGEGIKIQVRYERVEGAATARVRWLSRKGNQKWEGGSSKRKRDRKNVRKSERMFPKSKIQLWRYVVPSEGPTGGLTA